jgi:FkbM family methyltransferase
MATSPLALAHLKVPAVSGILALLGHHGVSRRGVLHVGAHYGLELEAYLACGFQRVSYVEANPALWPALEEHVDFWRRWGEVMQSYYGATPPRIEVLKAAASDGEGSARLHLTECSGQSSLMSPLDPGIRVLDEVEVRTARLDDLVDEVSAYSLLVLDIQGAELQALRGAPKLLEQARMVVVEVNYRRRYQGCPLAHEVDEFMEAHGYRAVARSQTVPWAVGGDVAYLRDQENGHA